MAGSSVGADITALLKSRHTLISLPTVEEGRALRLCLDAAAGARFPLREWDVEKGLTDSEGRVLNAGVTDPRAILALIANDRTRAVYVLKDFAPWLKDPTVTRALRNRARELQVVPPNEARAIILLSPDAELPRELSDHVAVVDLPLPDRGDVTRILDDTIGALKPELQAGAAPNGIRDAAIDAAVGLTTERVASCYSLSLVKTGGKIEPGKVAATKKAVIAAEPGLGLTWYDPDPRGLDAIGGQDLLKPWLKLRRGAFSERARKFGLPAPRGLLLVGLPGCGKSLTPKAVATAWVMPLLRADLGGAKSKYVGESEGNLRRLLKIAESVAPCVLWFDEIEKALAGATGPQGDGGVASDALGTLLSWMQEHTAPVFVIATANDVSGLPPELLRKGRFDELFFVDLPTTIERTEIVAVSLKQYGRDPQTIDCAAVAAATVGFTGAEIAAIVPDALFAAFGDGERAITTDDLIGAARTVVPLSKTAGEKIEGLRQWAKGRARPVSTPEAASVGTARSLDL